MQSTDVKEVKKQWPIQIFSTGTTKGSSVNVVKSPVKLKILSLLKGNEMEFDEIVRNIDKSKSTISVHLKSLRKEGVISFKMNPKDNRRKIFYINSKFLGEIEPPEYLEIEEQKIDFLVKNLVNTGNDFEFARLMFHTLRSTLMQEGITIDPLLYETGLKIGLSLYNNLKNDDLSVFVSNVTNFWKENGLGNIEIFKERGIFKVKSTDCFECGLLPKTGHPVCFLDLGIIESLFSSFMKKEIEVTEVKCYTMGDDCCLFEIEEL
jgi:predicted hydrocarbon binding protein